MIYDTRVGVDKIDHKSIQRAKYFGKWIWLDLASWDKKQEIPPYLSHIFVSNKSRGPRFWKVRLFEEKGFDKYIFEFDEFVDGHNCEGKIKNGHGYYSHYNGLDFYEEVGNPRYKFTSGRFKGQTASFLLSCEDSVILKFKENVGGFSMDGEHDKGSCVIIDRKDLEEKSELVWENK